MIYLCRIPEASRLSGVPASTIRRWLSEGRLCRVGARKPYTVDLYEVNTLTDLLHPGEH